MAKLTYTRDEIVEVMVAVRNGCCWHGRFLARPPGGEKPDRPRCDERVQGIPR